MSCYCDDCILIDLCGREGCCDEAVKFCADKDKFIYKSVIEDIKVDIEKEKELYNTDVSVNYIDYGIKIGLNMALNIISKHIGGDADE